MDIRERNFQDEFVFQASRSGGPGGQNVNKVSTKVELRFNVAKSVLLNEEEKAIISHKLANKISIVGELILISQKERSQLMNKENVIEKFYTLIQMTLTLRKNRHQTKPTKASVERRLESKRVQAIIKDSRKSVDL